MISRSGSLLSLVLVLLLVQAARADVITFANGNKIEGDIVSEDEEGVEIKLANGSTTIPHSQIAKIERKPSPEKEYQKRKDALKATDADGRVELAKFVHEKHLPQPRIPALLSEAFKIDPSCQGAIDMLVKLDYHFESGAWVAPETWYPAHDFVRKDNKWMTLEELDRIAAHDAIAAARKAVTQIQADILKLQDRIALLQNEKAMQATIANLKKDLTILDQKDTQAQAVLSARESDLSYADANHVQALQNLQTVQSQPMPKDPKAQQDYNTRLSLAQQQERQTASIESVALNARDAALQVTKDIADQKTRVSARLDDARTMLENARAELEKAQAALPKAEDALVQARENVTQAEDAETQKREALYTRKVRDEKAALDRADALAKWQKEHAPQPSER